MRIYNVVDHLNQSFGSYTSREKALRMVESLRLWFADKPYFVEEVHFEIN